MVKNAEIRPIFLEDWVDNLPYAHPDTVARQVVEDLDLQNSTKIKPATRLKLLEILSKPYGFLIDTCLNKSLSSLTVSAFEKNRSITRSCRKLALELIVGYRRLFEESSKAKSFLGSGKTHEQALQRCFAYLSQAILLCFHEYRPVPRGLWKAFHELYLFGDANNYLDTPFENPHLPAAMLDTARHIYRRTLLTCVVDPYHLSHGQIWELYQYVDEWVDDVKLIATPPEGKKASLFQINAAADSRPVPISHLPEVKTGKNIIYLDTSEALKKLQQLIGKLKLHGEQSYAKADTNVHLLQINLLTLLAREWGLPPKRTAPRNTHQGEIVLISGLNSIYHMFAEDSAIGVQEEDGIVTDEEGEEIAEHIIRQESWNIVNRSNTGFGIVSTDIPDHLIRVGELVACDNCSDGDGDRLQQLGIVRWLVIKPSGEYLAGIQILHGEPAVANIHLDDSRHSHPAILLSQQQAGHDVLITPANKAREGQSINIHTQHGDNRSIMLNTLRENTTHYDLFNYTQN